MPTWPASLPQFVLRGGYAEGFKSTVVRSPTDSGHTKRRQRFINGPEALDIVVALDDAQVLTFRQFYEEELGNGALRFTFPHPRLGTDVTVVLREDPESLVPEGASTYLLSLKLDILP